MKHFLVQIIVIFSVFALNAQTKYTQNIQREKSTKTNQIIKSNQLKTTESVTFLNEGFELSNFPPIGWSLLSPDGGTGWKKVIANSLIPGWNTGNVTVPINGGDACAFCTWETGGVTSSDQWLITPKLLNIQITDTIKFWALRFPKSYSDELQIKISTGNADTISDFTISGPIYSFIANSSDSTWTEYKIPVGSLVPVGSNIYVAFREYVADIASDGASIFIDRVTWGALPTNDMAVSNVISPISKCKLTTTEIVKVKLYNNGTSDASGFNVYFKVDNEMPKTNAFIGTITSGSKTDFTFTETADLSSNGVHTIKIWTSITGDGYNSNDTIIYNINNFAPSSTPYIMSFESNENTASWFINDNNSDNYTWHYFENNEDAHSGSKFARYYFNNDTATIANDWLISTCIQLNAGTNYQIAFWHKVFDANYPESFKVAMGNSENPTLLTTSIIDLPLQADIYWKRQVNNFTVAASGSYYFGFNCYSNANRYVLGIDDVMIGEGVGVNEISNEKINVFPNPAKDILNISSNEELKSITLYNNVGQEVYFNTNIQNNLSININKFECGIYFLKVETNSGVKTQKISIAK